MANELYTSGTMTFEDSSGAFAEMFFSAQQTTISTLRYVKEKISVGTTEEAMPLGEITTLGWFMMRNFDATNFVNVLVGTGGAAILRCPASSRIGPLRFGAGVTAPYFIADTGACLIEFMLTST